MIGLIGFIAVASLISLIFFGVMFQNMVRELRVQTKQQALLLALRKQEHGLILDDNVRSDYEIFFSMKRSTLFGY